MAQAKAKKRTSDSASSSALKRARAASSAQSDDWNRTLILGLILFFVTLIVYIPAMGAQFIWDDDQEITANALLKTLDGLWHIWYKPPTADYFPLKTTMLWIEYQIQILFRGNGLRPEPYHVVNILMHAIDVVLIWRLLLLLELPGAWFAALIFAIHPVNVESVAWIAERKNTLSMFFYVLSLMAYVRFEKDRAWKWYGWALLAFLASLLCKTSVVILPFVLLLIVWWRNRKLTVKDVLYSVPFFALSVFLGLVTIHFQNSRAIGGEVIKIGGFGSRLAGAGMAVWFYLSKVLFPYNLMEIYPRWEFLQPTWIMFVPGVLLVGVFYVLWRYRESWGRAPLAGFGYFVICLAPALGFFKMSYMRLTLVADHFTYLGILGIIVLVVGVAAYYYERSDGSARQIYHICAGAVVVLFLYLSASRAAVHKSEETLWADTLNRNPDTWQGHNHYGATLFMKGQVDEAMRHFADAVRLKPENPEVHNNLALALANKGRMEEAIQQYKLAAQIKDDDAAIRSNYANALESGHHFEEAIEQYKVAIKINPKDPATHCNMGYALFQTGQLEPAIEQFQAALNIDPNFQLARQNLNLALQKRAEREALSLQATPTPAPLPQTTSTLAPQATSTSNAKPQATPAPGPH